MQQDKLNLEVLVIRSFSLLGLTLEAYPTLGGQQLAHSSFNRTNEKLLLCLLHFLLDRLDQTFASSVSSNWPYFETREKNEYKRIVTVYILRVSSSNPAISMSDFRSSLLSVAKGPSVWVLLKKLSDAALELSIGSLVLSNQNHATVAMTLRQSNGLWATLGSANNEELSAAIKNEYDCIVREGKQCISRQNEQMKYSSELDARLKAATKNIHEVKTNMLKISKSEEVRFLSEAAVIERSELIMRVKEMQAALSQISISSSFAGCDAHQTYMYT